RARWTHRRAAPATHAKMRLDGDVIAVGANRRGRAHVDATRAAGLLRAAVRTSRRVQREVLGLFELAGQRRQPSNGLRLRKRIRARAEIAVRRLMHDELRLALQIEHQVEALDAAAAAALEID